MRWLGAAVRVPCDKERVLFFSLGEGAAEPC